LKTNDHNNLSIFPFEKCRGVLTGFLIDQNVVFQLVALDKLIALRDIQYDYELIVDYLKDFPVKPPVLYDASSTPPADKECRKKLETLLDEVFCAFAVVSDSRIGKMVVNIFFSLSKPKVPKQIFLKEEVSYDWLMERKLLNYDKF
jgi:hypothetical protein